MPIRPRLGKNSRSPFSSFLKAGSQMKMKFFLFAAATLLMSSPASNAQVPAGSTGQCRDGSYTTAAKKAGACSGHKGVQTWFAASQNAPATTNPIAPGQEPSSAATPAPNPPVAPSATPTSAKPAPAAPIKVTGQEPTPSSASTNSPRPQAPGGGPGMVWVNTSSKVYHCPGTEYYGTTKNGKYMSEADAISMGARADHNKACPK